MSEESIPQRYQDHPLLVVLENYVLAAIGQLDAERFAAMGEVVAGTWGGKPKDWAATIRDQFDLADDLDQQLQALWERNQGSVSPEEFARLIADENFKELLNEEEQDGQ